MPSGPAQVIGISDRRTKDLMPDATWSAAGIGRHQLEVNAWCLELGGHVRTGLEDNIKFDKDRLARSNGELVTRWQDCETVLDDTSEPCGST